MTPVDQTQFYDPANKVRGNCLQAALAAVLDLPLQAVPNFAEHHQSEWQENMFRWLWWLGLDIETCNPEHPPAGYSIAYGQSPRGVSHAVVALDGKVVHDPHPSRAGILGIAGYWQIVANKREPESRALSVKLVRQEHRFGCVVACIAMTLGYTYRQAMAIAERTDEELELNACMSFTDFDTAIGLYGYSVARRWKHNGLERRDWAHWPPTPWADLQQCDVEAGGGCAHSVLVRMDGTVIDPSTDEPRKLTDYAGVISMAAIGKVR